MNLLSLVAFTLLSAAELPPGHPPTAGSGLPPVHPQTEAGQLPPGHPPTGASGSTAGAGAMPANHPPLAGAPDAEELLKKLEQTKDLKDRDKPFDVALAMGKLYYGAARYQEAADLIGQALAKAEGTRKLFLEQRQKARAAKKELPSPEGAGCAPGAEVRFDEATKRAEEKARAGEPAAAAMCARVALIPVLDAHAMRGKALFMVGDAKGAVGEFTRALEVAEGDTELLFLRGNTLLDAMGNDLKALKQAKEDLAAVARAGTPRSVRAQRLLAQVDAAIAAGGIAKLNEKKAAERKANPVQVASAPPMNAPFAGGGNASPPPLTQEMVDAVQNTERTPELEQGLAKLVEEAEEHLARGRYQDALDAYKRVVPFQPENGRAKAGMAWALVGLNRQPMADRVWGVAVSADAKAVDELGSRLKAKGDGKGAKALWTKLASSAPDYAKSAGLEARLQ